MMDSMSHLILLSNQEGVGTLETQKHGAVHLSATRSDIIVDIHSPKSVMTFASPYTTLTLF